MVQQNLGHKLRGQGRSGTSVDLNLGLRVEMRAGDQQRQVQQSNQNQVQLTRRLQAGGDR